MATKIYKMAECPSLSATTSRNTQKTPASYGNKKKLPAVFFVDIFSDYPIETVKIYTSNQPK
jgi:hypothetical protein